MNEKKETTGSSSNGPETILVAEDEEIVKHFLQRSLEREGYRVLTASNGEEALARFMENMEDIDLVLTDVIMPVKSGIEVHDEINAIRPDTRFLFISGYTSDFIMNKGETDSKVAFITKPFEKQVVINKIREMLDE